MRYHTQHQLFHDLITVGLDFCPLQWRSKEGLGGPRAPGGTLWGAALRWPKINLWKKFKSSSFSLLF